MDLSLVQAPASLLLDPDLTPAAKVLWLAIRSCGGRARPTELAARSALTLATIRSGLAQLEARGWYSAAAGAIERPCGPELRPGAGTAARGRPEGATWGGGESRPPHAARCSIPAGLLADTRVRPRAKLFFGIIQVAPGFCRNSGEFSYTDLSSVARASIPTVRQIVRELVKTRWLDVTHENHLAPLQIKLALPDFDPAADEVARAASRLEEWEYSGEAFMKEFLSLLIDSDEFEDNARPGFLVNPLTG
jgi:hypothetical protein